MTADAYLVRLSWPSGALSGHAKGHWRPKAKATAAARNEAAWAARVAGIRSPWPTARLVLTYHPPKGNLPDVQNMPGRCKAFIDGIADAMGCDDRRFRVAYPETYADPAEGGALLIEVRKE